MSFPNEALQGDCEIDHGILLALLPSEVSTCVTYVRLQKNETCAHSHNQTP